MFCNGLSDDFVEDLFNFIKIDAENYKKKILRAHNKKITYSHRYDFIIIDFSHVSGLIFILNTYNNRKNQNNLTYKISCSMKQVLDRGRYKYCFTIYIDFKNSTMLDLCTCMLVILDIIPHDLLIHKFNNINISQYIDFFKLLIESLSNESKNIFSKLKFKNIYKGDFLNIHKNYGSLESENDLCIVCMDRNRNQVFRPCAHYIMCGICASSTVRCPVCRELITELIKIMKI